MVELRNPYNITGGWSDSPRNWSDVNFGDINIVMYLVDTPGSYTKEELKAYKSLEIYKMQLTSPSSLNFRAEPLEDHYEVNEELGRGNFAVVKKCRSKVSNEEFAAKCITKKRTRASKKGMSKEAIETEAAILQSVNHEGIIRLYDMFETKQNITLVMELLTGGELFEEIAKEEFILEKDACHYMKQILNAVGYLHSNSIVHLDLKPENIVLKSKGFREIKLVDFGLARKLQSGVEMREMMGTPEFAAPETINYDPVGFYTDMWALGVVTYILLSGASPFLGDNDSETYQNITICDYEFDDEYFSNITKNAQDFIRALLLKKGSERNTFEDCLKHPWIACEKFEDSVIDTKKMQAFVARRRWKQSLRMLTMISRLKILTKNNSPSPAPDVSTDGDARINYPVSPCQFIGVEELDSSLSIQDVPSLDSSLCENHSKQVLASTGAIDVEESKEDSFEANVSFEDYEIIDHADDSDYSNKTEVSRLTIAKENRIVDENMNQDKEEIENNVEKANSKETKSIETISNLRRLSNATSKVTTVISSGKITESNEEDGKTYLSVSNFEKKKRHSMEGINWDDNIMPDYLDETHDRSLKGAVAILQTTHKETLI
eukprot:gene10210-11259_t